ncbi:MAG TPA: nodulation protein NfeD [Terriglobia bacterium]|nr:nodulation protein NfeD [Terriglobia bacterium]
MKQGWACRFQNYALFGPGARAIAIVTVLMLGIAASSPELAETAPVVVQVNLDDTVEPVTAEYVTRGINHANQIHASAVLLELSTPGGLDTSMREIISAIEASRAPVITYVAPSGHRAASAGFFILLSGDLAVMAPGTNTGAAHPVLMGGEDIGKTMEGKIENDAAAYIRSIADKRGRNSKLAEEGVRESRSFTEKEALDGKLTDAIANTPSDIFAQFDGKTVKRFDDSTTTLHLAGAIIEPYEMSSRERFLSRIADPNIAFILGAIGVLCLYLEFNHPGMVAPGVVGAISLVLALYAFHLLPINYAGVLLILVALGLFVLEAQMPTHGVLAAGGIVAMVVGSLILIDSPFPGAGIRLGTSLSVTLPLAVIMVFLLRIALAARRQKVVTGDAGMIDSVGTAQTDLEPAGKIFVHGEIWEARTSGKIQKGARVRVRAVDGLTLVVEPVSGNH